MDSSIARLLIAFVEELLQEAPSNHVRYQAGLNLIEALEASRQGDTVDEGEVDTDDTLGLRIAPEEDTVVQ
jgi:hypothetical protein